mgnify:CR=1 FL=1
MSSSARGRRPFLGVVGAPTGGSTLTGTLAQTVPACTQAATGGTRTTRAARGRGTGLGVLGLPTAARSLVVDVPVAHGAMARPRRRPRTVMATGAQWVPMCTQAATGQVARPRPRYVALVVAGEL